MKKYAVHIVLAVVIIVFAVVIGSRYFNKQEDEVSSNSLATSEPVVTATTEPTPTVEPTAEPTEAPHEHVYAETITTEATCEEDGLKTFACECGDSYTESIEATGHVFENYVYNNDATYKVDGTETATCVCGLTDTRTAGGSKLEYTFQSIGLIMYAQQTVNVRDLPCTDGEKIGSLSMNEEVIVLRQCIETGWYEIQHITDGYIGYVSDSYLGTSKVSTSDSGRQEDNYVTPETDNPSNGNPGGSGGNSGGGTDLNLTPGMGGDGGPLTGDTVLNP